MREIWAEALDQRNGRARPTMPTPAADSPFATPRSFVDRRQAQERRRTERRIEEVPRGADRRDRSDRRHPMNRRETTSGHLRNALQTLMLLDLPQLDDEERAALSAAAQRLWFALFELQRQARELRSF
jgi:hypothetical protein